MNENVLDFEDWKNSMLESEESEIYERKFSKEEREKLSSEGKALPDGSYPINSKKDLKNAIKAYGRATDPDTVKTHIMKRAKEMGETALLPEDWTK